MIIFKRLSSMQPGVRIALLLITVLLGASPDKVHAFTFKIATLSPDGTFWMQQMRAGAKTIARKTNGRVTFKFYPGGVMGDDASVLRKIRLRQLHGAAITNFVLNSIYPDIQLYSLVLKFHNLQEVDYVRQKMDRVLMEGMESKGFVPLGFAEIGMVYIMSTTPVQSLEQMRSNKVWMPDENPVALEAMKAFAISPIPLPLRDVLMGLQTGMIDTVAASPVGALALQWHTKIRFVTDIPLLYSFGVLVLDQKAFAKLSAADQKVVREVMGQVIEEIDKRSRRDNLQAAEVLKNQGVEYLQPEQAAVNELRQTIDRRNRNFERNSHMSAEKMAQLNQYLAEIRRRKE